MAVPIWYAIWRLGTRWGFTIDHGLSLFNQIGPFEIFEVLCISNGQQRLNTVACVFCYLIPYQMYRTLRNGIQCLIDVSEAVMEIKCFFSGVACVGSLRYVLGYFFHMY